MTDTADLPTVDRARVAIRSFTPEIMFYSRYAEYQAALDAFEAAIRRDERERLRRGLVIPMTHDAEGESA